MGTISRFALAQEAALKASSHMHRTGHSVFAAAALHVHANSTIQQRHFTTREPITSHVYATRDLSEGGEFDVITLT